MRNIHTNEPQEYNTNTFQLFILLIIVTKYGSRLNIKPEGQITISNCVHILCHLVEVGTRVPFYNECLPYLFRFDFLFCYLASSVHHA